MEDLHARGISCVYVTVRNIVSGKQDARYGRQTTQRFVPTNVMEKTARLPAIDGAAMVGLRTLYPHTVVDASAGVAVLKSGRSSPKIGMVVLKGRWRGMPVYTLTLEERATCPVSRRHLRSCFGNKMQWAVRFNPGDKFERRLVEDVVHLAAKHPGGFVVRVHVLGDFYSVRYVDLWRAMLETVPELRAFGYTARWDDEIGARLRPLVREHWPRFAVRFSNAPAMGLPVTVSIELPVQRPKGAFVCPEQTNQTESCATCAACWSTRKTVAFLQH